jgi:hypothetical protein
MRVKVRFRFNAETGEIEVFGVDDLHEGPRLVDHDAWHDRAAADVARVVEANALIEEVRPVITEAPAETPVASAEEARPSVRDAELGRE